jgi:predicted ArsR family transcriptional regulator
MTAARDPIDQLGVLAELVRRRLYDHVVAQVEAVDRDAAAAAVGIGRPLAAFHLDRLAEAGLLDVEFHRRSGRTGPGAGRPAKFYRRASDARLDVTLPPRRYGLVAEILAEGIDDSAAPAARAGVLEAARRAGRALAADAPASGREGLLEVLTATGYEPRDEAGTIRLRNCPFDALVDEHRELTCSLNLALLGAMAEGVGETGVAPRPQTVEGYCCVAFDPA